MRPRFVTQRSRRGCVSRRRGRACSHTAMVEKTLRNTPKRTRSSICGLLGGGSARRDGQSLRPPICHSILESHGAKAVLLQQLDSLRSEHAVRTAAVRDNLLILGEFREAIFEFLQGDRDSTGNVASAVLFCWPHIQNGN